VKKNLKKVLSNIITGMAYNREAWIDRARNRMVGALGEYAKLRFAAMLGFDYDWEPEVKRLVKKIAELFDSSITKTKTSFNKANAFKEAYTEAAGSQDQVVYAKNRFEDNYLKSKKDIDKFLKLYREHFDEFDAENLLADMLAEYLPEIAKLIKK
jgi:hypothetical protein